MAGSQNQEDNPVAINVVPMVDVIFCLCVFFMCSFRFEQLEGKFDAWLPRTAGTGAAARDEPAEIRIAIVWDERTQRVRRRLGLRTIVDDKELEALIRGAHEDWRARGRAAVPVILDADERVPWEDVLRVVDLSKAAGVETIEFALGQPGR